MRVRRLGSRIVRVVAVTALVLLVLAPIVVQRVAAQAGPYTGLVIIIRAIHLDRSISPAVLTPSGEVVYGRGWWRPGQLNAEFAESYGIVEYAPSMMTVTRAGPRPLIINAIGVSGPVLSNFKTDVVVSDQDAQVIRAANSRSRFLQQMRVAFVNQPY
jgi:hypothetical protein